MNRRIAVCVIALLAAGCQSGAQGMPVPDGAVVRFGGTAAAAVIVDGVVKVVVAAPGESAFSAVTGGSANPAENSVRLLTYGGETRDAWNTFVYGTAEPGTSNVVLDWPTETVGGRVWNGAWLIVLHEKDVAPGQLHWQFRSADGRVVASGDGIKLP